MHHVSLKADQFRRIISTSKTVATRLMKKYVAAILHRTMFAMFRSFLTFMGKRCVKWNTKCEALRDFI